jgi:hypothetical protein
VELSFENLIKKSKPYYIKIYMDSDNEIINLFNRFEKVSFSLEKTIG